MKLKKRFISALALFVVGGVLFIFFFVDYGEKESKLNNTFRNVSLGDSLDHIVQKIQIPDKANLNCKGVVNVILKDYQKLRICTRYNDTLNLSICDVIEIGDRILKHAESDTFYLYKSHSGREGFDYFFLLERNQSEVKSE